MRSSHTIAQPFRFPALSVATLLLACSVLLAPRTAVGQISRPPGTATVQGSVRDSSARPLAGATVSLQTKERKTIASTKTDANGTYHFPDVAQGSYTVRAEKTGCGASASDPFVVGKNDVKIIDLMLRPTQPPQPSSSSTEPQFYDEPQFTVAGVTDTTNLGGHGSNAVVRTKESLAKEAASLSQQPSVSPQAPAADATTEALLRKAIQQTPDSFDANLQLGKFIAAAGNAKEALPYLKRAARVAPADLGVTDKAELHHLLADAEERSRNPLQAVHDYQRAAELIPSETNLFDWGAELLLHHAPEPATEVFSKGNRLFPQSRRMLIGLGVAAYSRGSYEEAARRLCEASDLNPADPDPYLFLGKIQSVESIRSRDVFNHLQRFAQVNPDNAWANYYYAVSLWKQRTVPADPAQTKQIELLLQKAIRLDPTLAAAQLQLGILHSDRGDFPAAIAAYQKAAAADPRLEAAHYRLAQTYRRTGETAKAQQELQLYEQLSKEAAAQVEREHREIQQFVYTLQGRTDPSPPQ